MTHRYDSVQNIYMQLAITHTNGVMNHAVHPGSTNSSVNYILAPVRLNCMVAKIILLKLFRSQLTH